MDTFTLTIIFLLIGFMEIILGIPLLLEKVKPNWIYGFRLPKTLSNKEIWYKTNKYAGRDLIVSGMIVTLGSLFLLTLSGSVSFDLIVFIGVLLIVVPVVLVLVRGLIYLKKL